MQDRAIKIALISIFATAEAQHFQKKIEWLLICDVFKYLGPKRNRKDLNEQLKLLLDIIEEHELDLDSKTMRSLIVSNNFGKEEKIMLLKIKLAHIFNV